ncbi:MAG: PepSY domain-containing protein [Ferrovibrio sp.]|uniref:PepSY-associated TM helix domain-containing protein n=1 Tax=Ferrovibrio sp. TaxID=1917215 RepID=UPI0026075D16|nr:PepSY domain-containing protein [Ferrovibrio sp.]MCW0235435.1 PepSY domain-containing protein [Ferrovibrio sp.]
MTVKTFKTWYLVHKWTSLICTAFLLMLCITGLPLIFHHEIEHLLGDTPEVAEMPAGTPIVPLDRLVAAAQQQRPGEQVMFMSWDDEEPELAWITTGPDMKANENLHFLAFDNRTGEVLKLISQNELSFMRIMFQLHVDLFAGLPGKLFLGFMGLLFVVAIVTGIAVYGPLMRKLDFGTVRKQRSARVKWLDLHNMLGIVTVVWALVVGGTGVINTWADLIIKYWQFDQLASMTAPYVGQPMPATLGSLEAAMATARKAAPDMDPAFVAFPGGNFSSPHHYAFFMRGDAPLTARLLKPVLVDAQTAALTDTRDMPWYVTALLVSQPLHFGDYGGMPLKVIWALFDIVTIVVLGSGLYLWLKRRRNPIEQRIRELEQDAGAPLGLAARSSL